MSKTSFLLVGVLSLSGLAVAGSKSYDISLPVAAKAGSLQLAAGDYKLKIDGTTATFTEPQTRKTFTAPIKMVSATHKFNFTAVETAPEAGTERITAIDLGGSSNQVEFTTK
jgi:hypothetical protein